MRAPSQRRAWWVTLANGQTLVIPPGLSAAAMDRLIARTGSHAVRIRKPNEKRPHKAGAWGGP